jgi:hypothetical protein
MTCGTTGAPGTLNAGTDEGGGIVEDCWGAPHRTHVAAEAGFMPPQDGQRM